MKALYVEPYEGGSHQYFGDQLVAGLDFEWTRLTLPARNWKWRMYGAASWFTLKNQETLQQEYDVLLCSSFVPLAEFKGLNPRLARTPCVLYFHENQFHYPIRHKKGERELHFGLLQMVSALAAERVCFNSEHNRDSFLEGAKQLLSFMPDYVPVEWLVQIRKKSRVLPLPLSLPTDLDFEELDVERERGPLILWNHRWEHDKNPELFFAALRVLIQSDTPFRVAVCGQQFSDVPPVFEHAREWLGERVVSWGHLPSRAAYEALLRRSHIAVSTSDQEFFGLSMLEATHFGARPLVPRRLVYPELYPAEFLYQDSKDLFENLQALCQAWTYGRIELRADRRRLTERFAADAVLPLYRDLFRELVAGA
ncbi:MAG: hypothetical protein AUK47_23770 [Deltaproteobacteria bacterium CG2_30_63_29]|nr:MAG: hypothetical protein AUK47_23770 [Deltaproteobacteria bacterium CG2_30_63_29]PJB44368.1 MAG: DUF3524 domain-containing protein [Deltaproteobacteria bacterium CG_4_9_14_3_um_filter_63_12]